MVSYTGRIASVEAMEPRLKSMNGLWVSNLVGTNFVPLMLKLGGMEVDAKGLCVLVESTLYEAVKDKSPVVHGILCVHAEDLIRAIVDDSQLRTEGVALWRKFFEEANNEATTALRMGTGGLIEHLIAKSKEKTDNPLMERVRSNFRQSLETAMEINRNKLGIPKEEYEN